MPLAYFAAKSSPYAVETDTELEDKENNIGRWFEIKMNEANDNDSWWHCRHWAGHPTIRAAELILIWIKISNYYASIKWMNHFEWSLPS